MFFQYDGDFSEFRIFVEVFDFYTSRNFLEF